MERPPRNVTPGQGAFESSGERIYFTATSERGERITYTGGPDVGGMMMGGALVCASCHGPTGRGGQHVMHMQVMDAPDIRLDRVMAQAHGFSLRDTVEILDEGLTVVGLGEGTDSWMACFFFKKQAAERLLLSPEATSFLLLTFELGAGPAAVESRLRRRLRDVEILPAVTVKQNDLDLLVQVFAIPLQMIITITFAVSTAILGMVAYTATAERRREYGVLKALGVKNRHLYWLVTQQGLVTARMGVALGIGLAWLPTG